MEKQKIAILVIHGIGQQDPYHTLDRFTRTLVEALQETRPAPYKLTHHRLPYQDAVDDYIKINQLNDPETEIDVHEYYWAFETERMISMGDIFQWLQQASDGAQRFYEENEQFSREYEGFQQDGQFRQRWYLKYAGGLLRVLLGAASAVHLVLPRWLDSLFRNLLPKATRHFIEYAGDVAAYTSTSRRSKLYKVRQNILKGAVSKIEMLLGCGHDKIVVIGHSLGSVVAYEALNEINLLMNRDAELRARRHQLCELVTFGSPLDKVAFFFRERVAKSEYVLQLIQNSLHGFRRLGLVDANAPEGVICTSSVRNYLQDLSWTNYWDPEDPVSGRLDFYEGVKNVKVENGMGIAAHTLYWSDKRMFRETIQRVRDAAWRREGPEQREWDIEFVVDHP